MRVAAWLAPMIPAAGLVLGGLLAGGMYATELRARARVTTQALRPVEPPAPLTLQAGAADAERGRVPYQRECAGCHGTTGGGNTPLRGPVLNAYYRADDVLAGLIRDGVGTMPGTPPAQLSDQDVADVIAFMRGLP